VAANAEVGAREKRIAKIKAVKTCLGSFSLSITLPMKNDLLALS
jgi:hypothetical protein